MDVGEYIRNKQKREQAGRRSERMTAKEAVDRYGGMSEEQLMQELFRVGRVSSGNISGRELDAFYDNVKSFLTPEQSEKMRGLIVQLKQR